ncbi:MAG: trimethylamine methyltransferase family protein [Phycisphaerae bacterium]|nr:trimethylamine methyltransferase family protein [Phycisphaerae bacterium]
MKLNVLGGEGIAKIDSAARRILRQTGVLVPHEEMLALLAKAGADVDAASGRARIPSGLIDDCLAAAGKAFTIHGRDRSKRAAFGIGTRNYNSIAGEAYWVDEDGRRRFATLDDVVSAARLGDVLPLINIVGAMSDPHEIDIAYRCVEVAAAQLRTTTKPITFWFHDRASARFVVELFSAVAGSADDLAQYPPAYPFLEPISPLRFNTNGIDLLFETAKVPLPVPIGPMAQTGMSAPATLAGTIAQETAEILAGLCVTQLIRAGTPVCFGGIPHAFDMRTTQLIFSGPEQGLMAVAMTEMGKHYGLPVYINVGLTDSKCVDAQAGLEAGASLLMGVLAGADIFGHMGIAGVDQASSLAMLVFQHEVIEYVEHAIRAIDLDDEHLALDVIEAVGPGGTFIDQDHTLDHFRSEVWAPNVLDRRFWEPWRQTGGTDTATRVRERLESLMATYVPVPLDDDVERDVQRVLDDARRHLGGNA